jgi:hypothetical protein
LKEERAEIAAEQTERHMGTFLYSRLQQWVDLLSQRHSLFGCRWGVAAFIYHKHKKTVAMETGCL